MDSGQWTRITCNERERERDCADYVTRDKDNRHEINKTRRFRYCCECVLARARKQSACAKNVYPHTDKQFFKSVVNNTLSSPRHSHHHIIALYTNNNTSPHQTLNSYFTINIYYINRI